MDKAPGIRRYLRFRLRSLMLLTLAVAAWLAYEGNQARTIRRHADALRALGCEVVLETSPWSLLRFFEPQTYGQRIFVVVAPAAALEDALPILQRQSHLRAVRVVCDGTIDLRPGRQELLELLPGTFVVPEAATLDYLGRQPGDTDYSRWPESKSRQRYQRFLAAVQQNEALPREVEEFIKPFAVDKPSFWWQPDKYAAIACDDGSLAEVLVVAEQDSQGFAESALALLLVDGQCVDALFLSKSGAEAFIYDKRPDGSTLLSFVYMGPGWNQPVPMLRSLGFYAIESRRFRRLQEAEELPH